MAAPGTKGKEIPKASALTAYEKPLVYKAASGQEISLTAAMVKKHLVSGHPEWVTDSELLVYMMTCKAKGLDPWVRDVWLVKYTQKDNAAPIVSIDYLRKRARAQEDCEGWEQGIIIETKDGQVKDTNGLIPPGAKLLGGWAQATPAGWKVKNRVEVNLSNYLKWKDEWEDGHKTGEKTLTAFWTEDKQPSQIAKVAESQLLRKLWPDQFQGLYTEGEIPDVTTLDLTPVTPIEAEKPDFDKLIITARPSLDQDSFGKFLDFCVAGQEIPVTIEQFKAEIMSKEGETDRLLKYYDRWVIEQKKPEQKKPENGGPK